MSSPRRATLTPLTAVILAAAALAASPASAQMPDRLPSVISVPDPTPPGGLAPDEDVVVALEIVIDPDGTVSDAKIARSGGEAFDAAALEAIRAGRFNPAMVGETPVAVRIEYEFTFRARPRRRGRVVPDVAERRAIEPAPGFVFAGSVTERGTRTPQAGVPVTLTDPRTGSTWEVLTDAEGDFIFYGLPAGRLTLDIFTGAFAPLRRTVRVSARDAEAATVGAERYNLSPGGLAAYRTVVKERRPPNAATVVDLTEEELTRVAGTFGDPTRVVATLPGVGRSPFGLGYYVVRGAQFDNTGFFIDDHPALILYHLLGGPGVIQPSLVERISFYPGGYPARYGGFAAGVIAVDTRDGPRDRWHLDVELDLFKAGALFSVPIDDGRGVITVSLRRSYYELLLPAFTEDLSLAYTDYMVSAAWDFSDSVRGRLVFIGSEDAVSTTSAATGGDSNSSTDFSLGFHRVNLSLEADLASDLTFVNSFVWEWDHTDNTRVAEGEDTIEGSVAGWFAQLRSYALWRPAEDFSFEAGLDLLYTDLRADLSIPGAPALGDPRPPDFDPSVISATIKNPTLAVAPYLSGDLEVAPGLRLLPGVRLNLWDYGDRLRVTADPKLAVRWQLDDAWTIKGMAGLAHQAPQIFQVAEPFGDPSLPPIESTQGSLGFEWRPGDDWMISLEGFVQLLDGLPQASNAVVGDDEGESLARIYFDSDLRGRAFGAELMIRKEFGGLVYGWLSYTVSRAERWRGPERGWGLFELDQTHILNLAWTVRLGNEWSLGARFQLASGNPYYPITDARYDADTNNYIPLYGPQDRLDVYHRLDIRLDKRWRFDDWMFEVFLDIQNLYNAQNPEAPRYSYDFRVRTPGVSIPFLPTIGFRAVF